MEKLTASIDQKANTMVCRELWSDLGFLVVQTARFMRLTFWELSWDVVEPIFFYLSSMYCVSQKERRLADLGMKRKRARKNLEGSFWNEQKKMNICYLCGLSPTL